MQRPYRPRNFDRREQAVEDLREKLNRMKLEKTVNAAVGTRNRPPPDPTYNILKDPLRGDNLDNEKKSGAKDCNIKYESKSNNERKHRSKPNENIKFENGNPKFNKESGGPRQKQNWKNHTPQDNQQPSNWRLKTLPQHSIKQQSVNNIKVIVCNESGERKCTMDETVLVQLPAKARKHYMPKSGKGSTKQDSDKSNTVDVNTEKNENQEKQLQCLVVETKGQALTTYGSSQALETVANDDKDKTVIDKEGSETKSE